MAFGDTGVRIFGLRQVKLVSMGAVASGAIVLAAARPAVGDTITLHGVVFELTDGTGATGDNVEVDISGSSTVTGDGEAILAAIKANIAGLNNAATAGALDTNYTITLTWGTVGVAGNDADVAETGTNLSATDMAGGLDPVTASLNAAQTMTFKERLKSGELAGNDKTLAVVSYSDAVEWELEEGGISLPVYALMTGRTAAVTGTGTTEVLTMNADAATAFPYFKIYGKSIGDAGDDVHVKIYKAKVMGGIEGQFADGEFFVSKCSGVAIDDGSVGIYDIVHNETTAALP